MLAGLALWLALAALPVVHFGVRTPLVLAAIAPLPLLFVRQTSVLFVLGLLPLCVIQPDLFSPRVHGSLGILGASGLLAGYLVLCLRTPASPGARPTGLGRRRRLGSVLVGTATALCALALAVPYLTPVADSLRRGYPADPGAATVLLAIAVLALAAGLVLGYLAAPLDAAARGRS